MKEAQPSARRVSQASDPMQSAANAGEGGSQFRQELLARFSGCDAARRAREQPDTDLFLESANRMTEGGLRHSGPLCRLRKAPLVGDGQKRGHQAEFVSDHS